MVDGLRREYEGQARVLRVDMLSETGRTLASRYGVTAVPAVLIFDGDEELYRHQARTIPVAEIRRVLDKAGA